VSEEVAVSARQQRVLEAYRELAANGEEPTQSMVAEAIGENARAVARMFAELRAKRLIPSTKQELTERERATLVAISKFKTDNGFAPSLTELAKVLNLKTVSSAREIAMRLKAKGYVSWNANGARTLQIIKDFE